MDNKLKKGARELTLEDGSILYTKQPNQIARQLFADFGGNKCLRGNGKPCFKDARALSDHLTMAFNKNNIRGEQLQSKGKTGKGGQYWLSIDDIWYHLMEWTDKAKNTKGATVHFRWGRNTDNQNITDRRIRKQVVAQINSNSPIKEHDLDNDEFGSTQQKEESKVQTEEPKVQIKRMTKYMTQINGDLTGDTVEASCEQEAHKLICVELCRDMDIKLIPLKNSKPKVRLEV